MHPEYKDTNINERNLVANKADFNGIPRLFKIITLMTSFLQKPRKILRIFMGWLSMKNFLRNKLVLSEVIEAKQTFF